MRPLSTANGIRSLCKTRLSPTTTTAACFHSSTQLRERTRPRVHTKKKPEPPKPGPWWKPFEVTNVVLDLDSYESSYTRPYDEAEEEAQSQKWALNPRREGMKQRIDEFNVGREAAKARFDEVSQKAWQPWRVSDLDIMTAALRGAPTQSVPQTGVEGFQQKVVERNGIPTTVYRNDQRLLEWLIHRKPQTLALRTNADVLTRLLEEQTTSEGFHEVLSRLLTSKESAEFLSNYAFIIGKVISDALDDRLARPLALLPLLNSLLLRCDAKNYALGPQLCTVGMKMSAEAFRLKALKLYLDHVFKHHHVISPTTVIEILRPLHKVVVQGRSEDSGQLAEDAGTDRSAQSIRTPAFELLLFHLLVGKTKKTNSSKSFPCFRTIIENDPSAPEELRIMYRELVDKVRPSAENIAENIEPAHDETEPANP
ncbi:hypothetical protein CkaCkLH20_09921 [Colletotrichum karsti]|uniref:Uncharacterized protein n=1 Tax=Colletotrichum karsti TaxID=1095194 RepID=A0A9P6HWX7_9PEZI|nr:uncharacterized protein CkaCkLH20_09921 [Colletotrichum karsti]KAF9872742.1 hypothetical protein CkaCkLH20_09921 [Colletotrichum karsti]